ncbi:hypothetical protein XELAEV_18026973mg [Xenopus laevis]|uniref:A-kinase anchor protein 7-like phosphoesterase domain-containing protein n=1 Tax=Xenopus laevis TaxID=8355 RepID=A0A974CUQ1_XENLA|nr:hypothetical protein XELAEV_18026973mg [Xenopus laevis]
MKKTGRFKKKNQNLNNKSMENSLMKLPFANADICSVFETTRTLDEKVKKKRKNVEENKDDGTNKKPKRANYFVSLPILNPKILGNISTFQDAVLKKEPKLSRAMVPKGSFHLTLFVTHLATEEELRVTEFRNEVVFGKITEGDSQATLKKISETIERIFKEKGIIAFGYKGFVPHLTFIKLSRAPKLRKQGLKKIHASLYEDFKEHNFGDELMVRLDLCSMLKKRQENGYYYTEASVNFANHDSGDSEAVEKASSTEIGAGKLMQSEHHSTGDSMFLSESIGSPSKNSLVGDMDGSLVENSESCNKNDNMEIMQLSTHIKSPVLGEGAQKQGEANSLFTKQAVNVIHFSDTSPEQKAKVKKKTLCGRAKDMGRINTQQMSRQDLKEASFADLVSLQKQRMQVEQEQREQNEESMCLLFDRLTMIQEQQTYTNKNLKGVNQKLSFISKQLGQIVQLLQPSAGISTSSQPQPLQVASIGKDSEEQPTLKADSIKEDMHPEDT